MCNVLLLLVGVGLLSVGGEALIRGALAAARRLGVSPLLSGLIIVGFGTSAPELVVSVNAAVAGQPDIATGNVIGSNIANSLLILGLCALITPMAVNPSVLRRDAVIVVVASIIFVALAVPGALGRSDGALLLSALAAYLLWAYWSERGGHSPAARLHTAAAEQPATLPGSVPWIVISVVAGLLLLIVGSQVLLEAASGIARHFGVSEAVIGLSLVAVGTSLPELTISVIAAIRRQADVAIGNVLGSNIFNLLGILGVSALLQPLPLHGRMLQFDQWVMLGASAALFVFLFTGRRLGRLEGGALLAGYGVYLALSFGTFGV